MTSGARHPNGLAARTTFSRQIFTKDAIFLFLVNGYSFHYAVGIEGEWVPNEHD